MTDKTPTKKHGLSRRKFLMQVSAATPVVALIALNGKYIGGLMPAQVATPAATANAALDCVASPSMTEGPYFVDEMLKRTDIRIDPTDNMTKPGTPLQLAIKVFSVNGDQCAPLKGAQVDIWHCDATGLYSDEQMNNTVGTKFLRGYQITDDNGDVTFMTIYPGWYQGRTVHIHTKIRTLAADGTQTSYAFNTQLFFDDTLSDQVYTEAPYSTHTGRDTRNATDNIYMATDDGSTSTTIDAHDVGTKTMLTLTKSGDGYATSVNIGVDLSKPSTETGGGPGGGGPGGPGGTRPNGGGPGGGLGGRGGTPPGGPGGPGTPPTSG